MSSSFAQRRQYPEETPFRASGTRIRVFGLKDTWGTSKITDLEENLARLISPFSDELGAFNIFLSRPGYESDERAEIESPGFLSRPKYSISGNADEHGDLKCNYQFRPLDGKGRSEKMACTWGQVYEHIQDTDRQSFSEDRAHCGPFRFQVRAWDLKPADTLEIADTFDLQKNTIRKSIRAHKGISVYRDGVLVLPKSDNARDWLGLDLRRVSKVGLRLSTSQIVGYVSLSAEDNPAISDTSDRERLVSTPEVAEFEEILIAAVRLLENGRSVDRIEPEPEQPLKDLFEGLNADSLLAEVVALAEDEVPASEAVPLLEAFNEQLDNVRETIQTRLVYYSRLATVGTIAQMLVHEIRNRTISFGCFLNYVKDCFSPFDERLGKEYESASDSVGALERLADTFLPLASRSFRRRKRKSVLEDRIRECLSLHKAALRKNNIECIVPKTETTVAVDPGELDAILLNLITNASYWLGQAPKGERKLSFSIGKQNRDKRVKVRVRDTGPGIEKEYRKKVFWPGVTRKPGGIGMGLTVASELVAEYGGRMAAEHSPNKRGATFIFDLPAKK